MITLLNTISFMVGLGVVVVWCFGIMA